MLNLTDWLIFNVVLLVFYVENPSLASPVCTGKYKCLHYNKFSFFGRMSKSKRNIN